MKALVLLFISFGVFVSAIPTFPVDFTADVVRSNTESTPDQIVVTSRHIIVNSQENFAYVEVATREGHSVYDEDGFYWLVESPEGADPGSPAAETFVEFILRNQTYEGDAELSCTYTTKLALGGPTVPPKEFPAHWEDEDGAITITNWFNFNNDLEYDGTATFEGLTVDAWYSEEHCYLFDDTDAVSCEVLFTSDDQPVYFQSAYQKQRSFEEDWVVVEDWQFEPSASLVPLPDNWLTTCYNAENGFEIDPVHGYVATPGGDDSFTIALTAPPVNSLGETVVKFEILKDGCSDCIEFTSATGTPVSQLAFDSSNWQQPQQVNIKFRSVGETYFIPYATGGGYEIRNWASGVGQDRTEGYPLRALTCNSGTPGYGCDESS